MFNIFFIIFVHILVTSCEEKLVSSTNRNILEAIAFRKLGSYRGFTDDGVEYHKTFYISRYVWASWIESLSFCKLYGLDFMTLETVNESQAFFDMADTNAFLKSQSPAYYFVDGFAMSLRSPTDWYWSTIGKKISFPIPWYPGSQHCLCLIKTSINGKFYFYDTSCTGVAGTVCQKTDILTPQSEK